MNCRPDPAFMLSIIFTILSFGLLTISYSKIFIEFPLSKLSVVVEQHSDKLSEHENNFQQIYLGTFSRDFATHLQRKIASEK
jgi:hypothetical protein